MRTNLSQVLLALGALLCTTPLSLADEPVSSELDRRLAALSQDQPAVPGVQQVAYLSEIATNDEPLPTMMAPMPGGTAEPSVDCGSECCYVSDCGCQPSVCDRYPEVCSRQPQRGMYYTEAQLMLLRAHVLEESLGKLSEKYEFTPRFIAGYEGASGLGARARYWTYGRTTPILNDEDDLRLEFEVIDVEGTSRFHSERADLVLACGFRWVNADIEVDDESVSSDMPGITVAADVRTRLCGGYRPRWSGVAGARFSILGADWEGDDGGLIAPTRDDNLVVTELYGGFEYLCQFRNSDLFARLVLETQNWRSDALGESADTDSLGFFGPGIHVGATF